MHLHPESFFVFSQKVHRTAHHRWTALLRFKTREIQQCTIKKKQNKIPQKRPAENSLWPSLDQRAKVRSAMNDCCYAACAALTIFCGQLFFFGSLSLFPPNESGKREKLCKQRLLLNSTKLSAMLVRVSLSDFPRYNLALTNSSQIAKIGFWDLR